MEAAFRNCDTSMKYPFLALGGMLLLTSCAGVHVSETQVASGATNPRNIYIRPFSVEGGQFVGDHRGGVGERPIRQSLAPAEFSQALKEELEKLAPAMVLKDNEAPSRGWLVEGSLDVVDAGNPVGRFFSGPFGPGIGRSKVVMHVRISDLDRHSVAVDTKDASVLSQRGRVIYEFDLEGGSHSQGGSGSIYAPGTGYATPFDFRNAAERVMMALSTDPHRYGVRTSPVIR